MECPFPPFPFEQLTSLTFSSLTNNQTHEVYQHLPFCSRLEHLGLVIFETIDPPLPPTSLPTVKSLDLGVDYGVNLTPELYLRSDSAKLLLSSLLCPSLTTLRVAFEFYDTEDLWLPAFLNTLDHTCASLRDLEINYRALHWQEDPNARLMSRILERASNLRSFQATINPKTKGYSSYNSQILRDLFNSLSKREGRRLAPKLEEISLEVSSVSGNDVLDVVDDMIQTAKLRCGWGGDSLEMIQLYISMVGDKPEDLTEELARKIEELRKDGVFIGLETTIDRSVYVLVQSGHGRTTQIDEGDHDAS